MTIAYKLRRYEQRTFKAGDLPLFVEYATFSRCKFEGPLPDFNQCQFHDCDLSGLKIGRLTHCLLFATNLSGCDFTRADVSYSQTHPGSPCDANKTRWAGVRGIFDCGFWRGLRTDDDTAWQFVAMALIPETPVRDEVLAAIPKSRRRSLLALLAAPFRKR